MSDVFSIATSGLRAQSTRLAVSADNVANQRSLGADPGSGQAAPGAFVPQEVALTAVPGGGVRAETRPVDPPSRPSYEPGAPEAGADGTIPRPNVSLEREFVVQIEAQRAYEASLKVLETADKMHSGLVDILS